ncbi:MAG: hypothetical protein ABSC17_07175 [Thermacetogeniaceae bacterium]
MRIKLAAVIFLILGLAIGYAALGRVTSGLHAKAGVPAETPAGSRLPPERVQIAAIKQLNDTFFDVMSEYTAIRREYSADKQQDRDSRFIPRVESLYKIIAAVRGRISLFQVDPGYQQALGNAQQNSLYLASSIFEFYDALLTQGDYRRMQLDNSAKDYDKALPYFTALSAAHQAS